MIRLSANIKKYIQLGSLTLLVIVSLAFSHSRQYIRTSTGVQVMIDNTYENYFVEKDEVTELLNGGLQDYITGSYLSDLDLRRLESNIENHPYVEKTQVYRDLQGIVMVEVTQKRPMARLFKRGAKDYYITESGEIVNESAKYTARVPLIEMENSSMIGNVNMNETEYGANLYKMLTEINESEFWRAQLAGLSIDKSGEITIQPQVTRQLIEFGQPVEVSSKLKKLKIFYKQILPVQGWNTYNRVSVKYENQIICE